METRFKFRDDMVAIIRETWARQKREEDLERVFKYSTERIQRAITLSANRGENKVVLRYQKMTGAIEYISYCCSTAQARTILESLGYYIENIEDMSITVLIDKYSDRE